MPPRGSARPTNRSNGSPGIECLKTLSPAAQTLWDNYGEAYDAHVDASDRETGTKEERLAASGAYLKACAALHDFIVDLEQK